MGADLGFFLRSSDVSTFTLSVMSLSVINGKETVPGCYLPLLGVLHLFTQRGRSLFEWSQSPLRLSLFKLVSAEVRLHGQNCHRLCGFHY